MSDYMKFNYGNSIFKATVTGKRQITIPKELCELLNIKTGEKVMFKKDEEEMKIIFFKDPGDKPCFGCNETGKIEGNTCFVCNGKGILESEVYEDFFLLFGDILINSYEALMESGTTIGLINNEEGEKEGDIKKLEVPKLELHSKKISESEIIRIQNIFQELIIKNIMDNKGEITL